MAPVIKFDGAGRPYRCYSPGLPLKHSGVWPPDPDDAIPWHDELVVLNDRGLKHYYASATQFAAFKDGQDARQEVMQKAKEYQHKHAVTFNEAMGAVLADQTLKERYAAFSA